jgi:hypothetical protein
MELNARVRIKHEDDLELLEKDQQYWLVDLTSPDLASQYKWHGSSEEYSWAERGLIHLKKQNAISHAKALIQATVGVKRNETYCTCATSLYFELL